MTEPKDLSEYNTSACPKCESENITGGNVDIDATYAWQSVWCNECHYEWRDVFKLCGVEDAETGKAIFEKKPVNRDTIEDGVISIKWGVDDVLGRAIELKVEIDESDAEKILSNILRRHDAETGVNWDVIDCHIIMYLRDKEKS